MAPSSVFSRRLRVCNYTAPTYSAFLDHPSATLLRFVLRLTNKLEPRDTGVSSFDISLEKQEVVVKATAPYETVLEKIKKTGKEVRESIHHLHSSRAD